MKELKVAKDKAESAWKCPQCGTTNALYHVCVSEQGGVYVGGDPNYDWQPNEGMRARYEKPRGDMLVPNEDSILNDALFLRSYSNPWTQEWGF